MAFAAVAIVLALAVLGLVVLGPDRAPPPMTSVVSPFEHLDMSDLPEQQQFRARDGTLLAYREYPSNARRVLIAVHGSSSRGKDLHILAKALSASGTAIVYAPDIRGHGESGNHGDIAYLGQLEDDMADLLALVKSEQPGLPVELLGFSSGGGFVLRIAGSPVGDGFAGFVLVSPYLAYDAPTVRPGSGGWALPNVPRIIGLGILHRLHLRAFEGLPVVRFAVAEGAEEVVTSWYSYRLQSNFGPHRDYASDLRRAISGGRPLAALVGAQDEIMNADQFAPLFARLAPTATVDVLPRMNHISMTLQPSACDAIAARLRVMP